MALLQAHLVQPQVLTTNNRNLLNLGQADAGRMIWNSTDSELQVWDGAVWRNIAREPVIDGGIY